MMDETTTRRGFLKGILAAAALATAVPPLLLQAAEPAAEEPAGREIPYMEKGEFWLNHKAHWELIGGITSLSVHEDIEEFQSWNTPFVERRYALPRTTNVDVELAMDAQGQELLLDCFGPWNVHAGFMIGGFRMMAENAAISSVQMAPSPREARWIDTRVGLVFGRLQSWRA